MSSFLQDSAVTVGTASPVALGSNGFQGRAGITIFNNGGGGVLFIGGPNVTVSTGVAIASNAAPLILNTPQGAAVYGIGSLAGTQVRVIEF